MLIHAQRLVTADEVYEPGLLRTEGDRVVEVGPRHGSGDAGRPDVEVGTLAPGLVDVHSHGGGGASFSTDPATAIEAHRRTGTTTQVASLVTETYDDLEAQVRMLAPYVESGELAGIHLEGPWLAAARCGAHDPALLRDPDPAEVARLLDLGRGHVRQVTFAPERKGALELVGTLVDAGVHAAVGHTAADYAQVAAAVEAGADIATHLFNGMDPWHHRTPGAVPALLRAAVQGEVVLELIADGVHLADETVATVMDLVGPDRVVFVSDAMAAAGVGDGRYVLGGLAVVVTDGVARLDHGPGEPPGPIAGGTSHVADLVARAVRAGMPLAYAAEAGSATPARLLGLEDRGVLAPGARADLVVVDDVGQVARVMRAGRWLDA